jgi:hypothetical protein
MNDKQVTIHQQDPTAQRVASYPSPASYSFEQIQRMAGAFAKSGLFGVKDENQALSLMLYAQATGKHPALIMRDYDVIQGRLAKKSEVMLRDYQASGGSVEWTKYADDGVTGIFRHPLAPRPLEVSWDLDRATKAGLVSKDGSMYKKYPRAMFRSRVISEGVRATAPDVTEQMHTPEEVRAIEQEQEPMSVTVAVAETVKESRNALPPEEVEVLLKSLEVATVAELTPAFGRAYTRAKEAKDEVTKQKLKARYDERKNEIAAEIAQKEAEAAAERAAIEGEGKPS